MSFLDNMSLNMLKKCSVSLSYRTTFPGSIHDDARIQVKQVLFDQFEEMEVCSSLPMLQWAYEHENYKLTTETYWFAAARGQLEVLKWVYTTNDHDCEDDGGGVCWIAARMGYLHVLDWAAKNGFGVLKDLCVKAARAGGHQKVIEWLEDNIDSDDVYVGCMSV